MKKYQLISLAAAALILQSVCFADDTAATKKPVEKKAEKTAEKKADKPAAEKKMDGADTKEGAKPAVKSAFNNDKDKLSYIIGQQVGGGLKRDGLEINVKILGESIESAVAGKPSLMSDGEIKEFMMEFGKKMQEKMEAKHKESAQKGTAEGKAFLEKMAKEEGVKSTPSGLLYKVIKEGTGAQPKASDKVRVHYTGKFIDGKKFDSSYDRNEPTEFGLAQVIKGWTEGLQLMKEGSKYMLYIPSELGYGADTRNPDMPPNSVLVFEVELLKVIAPAESK